MPNTEKNFNPAYSTIKSITLTDLTKELETLIITENNTENNTVCRFERLEMVENINDTCPTGAILVVDFQDIVSYIVKKKLQKVLIEFFDGVIWEFDITSISYSNNAVSVGEDTLVTIHFSNKWYKKFASNSLNDLLTYKKPKVFRINEFIEDVKQKAFYNDGFGEPTTTDESVSCTTKPYNDTATNYFLYKPFNPYNDGEEFVSDDVLEMMNYVASLAIDEEQNPNFFFWTSLDGSVNFKSFKRNASLDCSVTTIDDDFRRVGVFEGDSVLQTLSDGKVYRKAYFLATNPALQWISKNYYYIRKTPKYLDEITGLSGSSASNEAIKNLSYHFQDDGQKYNIDVIHYEGRNGLTGAPKGGQALVPEYSWGYYDKTETPNRKSITTLNNNQFGIDSIYGKMPLMGHSGYMPYLDSPDMWKNMFNLTPIHPNYPDFSYATATETTEGAGEDVVTGTVTTDSIAPDGIDTNLQKVIDIRYKVFERAGITGASADNLDLMRKIEVQNFVLYSLCCMGKKEDCFFAMLTKYEEDISINQTSENTHTAKKYRYKWNKLQFGGASGASGYCFCGSSGGNDQISGASGTTGAHILENWCLDSNIKSSDIQDDTWAINVNERGITSGTSTYLPPGWLAPSTTSNFYYRPIGSKISPPGTGTAGEQIHHIVRLCKERIDANNTIYYFWAENVVDGTC